MINIFMGRKKIIETEEEQFRDIGRIAAVITAVSKVLAN